MSIGDIINPWGRLRESRWLAASQKREIEALYIKLGEAETRASEVATNELVIRILRSKLERLNDTIKEMQK